MSDDKAQGVALGEDIERTVEVKVTGGEKVRGLRGHGVGHANRCQGPLFRVKRRTWFLEPNI